MIISVTNQKGGVGKTTLSINLSCCLATMGYRVLTIDMDPQGNCTDGLGVNASHIKKTIYDVLIDETPLNEAVIPHSIKNLFVIPANMSLFGAEAELSTEITRPFKLRQALRTEIYKYDYIFIDCPPNLGVLTINAIMASTGVLVPIEPNSYALKGLSVLMNSLLIVQNDLEHYPDFLGVVINMFDPQNDLHVSIFKNVTEHFPLEKIFRNKIHRTPIIAEAEIHGQSIIEYQHEHTITKTFLRLAEEIVTKTHERTKQPKEKAVR